MFNENLGNYYFNKFGLDFRSIRYPGIISSAKYAFNGTTDYSTGIDIFISFYLLFIEIFFHALEKKSYKCFLGPETYLPMMYIDDCIE